MTDEMKDRFKFGENWSEYADRLGPEDYTKAKESVTRLVPNLSGKTFLDVGCGSGLFSIAASAHGASFVQGIDLDPQSVETAKRLVNKAAAWDETIKPDQIDFKIASILDPEADKTTYDVVYSWGVLHHTGDMYGAFDAIIKFVKPGGRLVIAIYNRHWTAPIWTWIKWFYVKSPGFIKKLMAWSFYVVKLFVAFVVTRQNPFKRRRGMHYYSDIVDWIGGYPYEYASIQECSDYFEKRGFTCTFTNPTQGWTGCNELVFERQA